MDDPDYQMTTGKLIEFLKEVPPDTPIQVMANDEYSYMLHRKHLDTFERDGKVFFSIDL